MYPIPAPFHGIPNIPSAAQQAHYDASPERVDITIISVFEQPILHEGQVVGKDLIVEYAPTGSDDMIRITAPASELLAVEPTDDPDNAVINCAKSRAAAISRAIAHFAQTSTTPDGDIPLESWAGLTPVMCKALRKAGVRSLQELANASEPTIARMHIMNPRKVIDHCRMYLASLSATQTTQAIIDAREENANLKAQLNDMQEKFTEILQRLAIDPDAVSKLAPSDGEAPRRPRGRPPGSGAQAEDRKSVV